MIQYKLFAYLLGIFFCVCPFVGFSQLQVSVVLPMQMPAELSEWQTNPALVQIIITSLPGTPEFPSARCEFVLRDADNQNVVVSTKTNHPSIPRFPIAAGPSTQIRFGRDIVQMNSLNINQEFQTNFLATNSLPEGNYEFCLEIYDDRSNQLIYSSTLQGICTPFIVVVPDPPSLILPADGDVILSNYPVFSWTPVMMGDGSIVRYNLKVVPLFEGQNARFALDYNEVIADVKDIQSNSYMYSPTERPFIHYPQAIGFAWQVQAVSLQGNPVTRNNGKSELFTFYLNKDTTTTPVADDKISEEPEIQEPEYTPNKKRSIQFGEFWVTLANDIDCNSCILNVDGYAFLPFLNDSVRVTLVNVPITNIDKPYYVALAGEASNNQQFSTKTKNSVSVVLSSLSLTPTSASLNVSTSMKWQSFGWMNGENTSQPTKVVISPKGFQYGIALDVPWKRNGNQIGVNGLFEASVDSLYTTLSFSKISVEGKIVVCPNNNTSSSTQISFDCQHSQVDLSAKQASVLFDIANSPIKIHTPTSSLISNQFAIDLSSTESIKNEQMQREWKGVQLFESSGIVSVKAPFASRIPVKVQSTSSLVTPTSNSFVITGKFGIDSLSCSYGGFPIVATSGSIQLEENQSTGEPLVGSISLLSASKPTNWVDLENIPVEISLDKDLQLQLRLGKKLQEETVASLPLSFVGIDDTLSLRLSKGVINVQSESEATVTFLGPIIFNEKKNEQLSLNNLIFKSSSNKIEQSTLGENVSLSQDFSLNGALFSVQTSQFMYTSPKEYALIMDGVVKGIGKRMPEKLQSVPFSQLQISTISPVSSKSVSFDFGYNNEFRALGKASIVQEQIGDKKFLGLKGSAKVSLQYPFALEDINATLYFGSLNSSAFWNISNTSLPNFADAILAPSQSQQRSASVAQYVQSESQGLVSSKLPTIGGFVIEKILFGIGTNESGTSSDENIQSTFYSEAMYKVDKSTYCKLGTYILSNNNTIQSVEGQMVLGQRGLFSINSAKTIQLTSSSMISFSGEGKIDLTKKESSNAKVLIEHSNNQSTIAISEVNGTISISSTFNEPLRSSNTDLEFDNASLIVTRNGIEAVGGVTISSIYGTEGNEPTFIAIQKKPISNLVLDVTSKEQMLAIANVKGTIITSYDDDPCTQWGTLKGISPQGILANPGTQSVGTFSVGELSDCGTPMSAFQQGNFSLCYSTMNNEFSCSTPLTITANNAVQSFSIGNCSNCAEFEKKINSSKKSLTNLTPKLIVVENTPFKGAIDVDASLSVKCTYKVTNVEKSTKNGSSTTISLTFDSDNTSSYQFDSLWTEYFQLVDGKTIKLESPSFSPCSQYQLRVFVRIREKNSQNTKVLTDTISWTTAAISKSILASHQMEYSTKNSVPTISIINRTTKLPIINVQNFWKQHKIVKNSLVEKGVTIQNNSQQIQLQLPSLIEQKSELVAIAVDQQCSQPISLYTTAYPQLQNASYSLSVLNENEVEIQFTNIPVGIGYTVTLKSYCEKELQQIVTKQLYSPTSLQQKATTQTISIPSILGVKQKNCPTNGYTISIEFPSQFSLPQQCISIGTAPQCLPSKKE